MKNFVKLTKNEMKMVLGGDRTIEGGCPASTCTSNADCKETQFPSCYVQTCTETGQSANFCGVA